MSEPHDQGYGLVCPFLNEDPVFAYGVEFGMLYARMLHGDETVIDDCFLLKNQDQILLLASRLGWRVKKMAKLDRDWFRIKMRRSKAVV